MKPAERLKVIAKLHGPRGVPPLNSGTTNVPPRRSICNACEVSWWPCITYRIATGDLDADPGYPDTSTKEPFGHESTQAAEDSVDGRIVGAE
jgi:hypothetical protein